jgi:hypothetical protein
MNINLLFETILVLFAILASNGILYGLTFFHINKPNSSENISVLTNSSEKDGLFLTALIASNPIILASLESSESETLSLTSSESSESEALSLTSSESSESEALSLTSSETNVSQDIYDIDNLFYSDYLDYSEISEATYTSLDSITMLDNQAFEQWRDLVMELHDHPINSPAWVIQQIKWEELNILYSQDIILHGITQSELRIIIEHLPAMSLFNAEVNHLILTMMSYYHT